VLGGWRLRTRAGQQHTASRGTGTECVLSLAVCVVQLTWGANCLRPTRQASKSHHSGTLTQFSEWDAPERCDNVSRSSTLLLVTRVTCAAAHAHSSHNRAFTGGGNGVRCVCGSHGPSATLHLPHALAPMVVGGACGTD
jgi:hypothetical protein